MGTAQQLIDECDEKEFLFEEDFRNWLYNSQSERANLVASQSKSNKRDKGNSDRWDTSSYSDGVKKVGDTSGSFGYSPFLPEGLCFNLSYIRDNTNPLTELNIPIYK